MLAVHYRRIVREAKCVLVKQKFKKKDILVYLFNDIILFAESTGNNAKRNCVVIGLLHLANVKIENAPDFEELKNGITLSNSILSYTMYLSNSEEKVSFINDTNNITAQLNKIFSSIDYKDIEQLRLKLAEINRKINIVDGEKTSMNIELSKKSSKLVKVEQELTLKQKQKKDLEDMVIKNPANYPRLLKLCGINDIMDMSKIILDFEKQKAALQDEVYVITRQYLEKSNEFDILQTEKEEREKVLPAIKLF